jgi:hypothetical protein
MVGSVPMAAHHGQGGCALKHVGDPRELLRHGPRGQANEN